MARLVQQELFDWPEDPDGADRQKKGPDGTAVDSITDGGDRGADRPDRDTAVPDKPERDRHRQEDRDDRLERFLTERMPQGQGQTASAARQVRIDQEYGTDLFARLSQYSDGTGHPDSTGRPSRHERRPRTGASGPSVLFETGQEARWQILPGALRFALAAYPPDFVFARGFWSRLQELLDRHEACLAPDCRPLLQGTGLLDTGGDGVFGTAPVRVDSPADPQVPTGMSRMSAEGRPTASVVGLLRLMRDAGGF